MSNSQSYNPQNSADFIRGDTRDTRRYLAAPRPSPPLKGLRATHTVIVSYRAVVPAGADDSGVPLTYRAMVPAGAGDSRVPLTYQALAPAGADDSGSRPTANY